MAAAPRVRFAPSPTGALHIGGVRTALFNWLWARKTGGTFILRIEDTDQERSTEASRAVILDSLRWLGLDWDEGPDIGGPRGPYVQSDRLPIYRAAAEALVASGKAYRCFCTKAELDAQREAVKARDPKASFRYPGTCRVRKDEPDRPFVVRLRVPETGAVTYHDKVFGIVTTPNAAQQDFVLLRTDGVPLYNFGAVVDDAGMGVTLVARGRDHMVNTPPQLLLYEALGEKPPEFAHLPMMLAPTGEKLSKRHGAVSVTEYREQGYAPDAILNYLSRFGWSYDGSREIFSRKELVELFSWERCGKGDGKFDAKKFLAIQHEHIKSRDLLPDDSYTEHLLPFLERRGLVGLSRDQVVRAQATVRERARTFVEAAEQMDFYFREPPQMDEAAAALHLTPATAPLLRGLTGVLEGIEAWTEQALHDAVMAHLAHHGLTIKDVAQPARVALTGRAQSPGLFQLMAVLGKDRTLARLRAGAQRAEGS